MSRRVVVQSGNSAHPFRVGAPGVNADTAGVFDLFFDGNQSPLRLYGTGFISSPPLAVDNVSPAWFVAGPPIIVTPAGTFPVFVINGRASYNPNFGPSDLTTAFHATNSTGFGGIVANDRVYSINFGHDRNPTGNNPVFLTAALVNYCIMRNYG